MASPVYATDLVDIDLAEATGKTWAEPTATGWGAGGAPATDGENYIQGNASKSKTFNATGVGGMMVNNGGAITLPTDGAFLGWYYWASPKTLNTDAEGGIRLMVGTDLANFKSWDVGGKTSYVYGGWINYAVNTTIQEDDLVGAGLGNSQYIGGAYWNLDAITKGNPCLVDAFRYGRCEARMSGGEGPANYATFAGFASANDAPTARWGLIQAIAGGYLVKGLIVLGYGSVVDFKDANRTLIIQNTNKVTSGFNRFEVRQAGSKVEWKAISITALGTVSRGDFEAVDDADIDFDFCTFTDMGIFIFKSQSTILNTIFRRCQLVTQNSAVFDGCTFENTADSVKALLSDRLDKISSSTFISGETGHAIELTPATPSEIDLIDVFFTGYGATGTADAAIFNNSGKTVKIIVSGGTAPTYKNGIEGSETQIVSGVKYSFTVKGEAGETVVNYEWRLYKNPTNGGYGTEIDGNENEILAGRTYVYDYTQDINVVLQVLHEDYIEYILKDKLESKDKTVSIILKREVND